MKKDEVWKRVKGYPNYLVSNFGRVRSIDRTDGLNRIKDGKILKPWKVSENRNGDNCLLGVSLYKLDHRKVLVHKKALVQKLVAEAFLGKKPGKVIIHLNGQKKKCQSKNLKWVTKSEANIITKGL